MEPQGLTAVYSPEFAPDGAIRSAYEVPPSFIGFDGEELTLEGVTAGAPAFAVDAAGRFHVAWAQFASQTDAPDGMVYRSSEDGGRTWSEPELLNEQVWLTHELVADGQGNVHWLAVNGTYRHWTPSDGWSDAVQTGGTGLGNARLAVDAEGRARVVFTATDGIYIAEQGSDGTWAEPHLIEVSRGTAAGAVVIAIDEAGRSHIVWVASEEKPVILYTEG